MFKRFLLLIICMLSLSLFGSANWTQEEIKYFQEKEYTGNKEYYHIWEYNFYPDYISEVYKEEMKGVIGKYPDDVYTISINNLRSRFCEKVSVELMEKFKRYFKYLKNEIYARNGYRFKGNIREFFAKMDWYNGKMEKVKLNDYERTNIRKIKELENALEQGIKNGKLFKKEVVLKSKWGDGPGEFKLLPLPETHSLELHFCLGPNNRIYILDRNNGRINIFNIKTGNFVKEISIPDELIYTYKDRISVKVEGIGVDRGGNIYLASSSTSKILRTGKGEVILKIDKNGNIIEKYIFKGAYVYPPYLIEDLRGKMHIWGSWKTGIYSFTNALIPLELGKGKGVNLENGFLTTYEFQGKMKFSDRWINFPDDKDIYTFNFSENSKVAYTDGREFIYMDANGQRKEKFMLFWKYYPRGFGFMYKGWKGIHVNSEEYIDRELNIYCLAGTPEGLRVIKYTPSEEIWE